MNDEHMIYYVTIKGYPTPIAIWAKDHDDYESQLRQFLDDEKLQFPDKAITRLSGQKIQKGGNHGILSA